MDRVTTLPILVYHSLDHLGTLISTAPEIFEKHLIWLRKHEWRTIRMSDAASAIRAGQPLERKTCAITFDDAMVSVREIATPMLEKYNFTATTFIITGQVGSRPAWYRLAEPYRRTPLLSVDALRELAAAGWELQPHTHDHAVLSHLPYEAQLDQIRRSRDLVGEWFGGPADVLAYPFGQQNADTVRAMESAGMAAGLTLRFSIRLDSERRYAWPRIGSAWLKDSSLRQRLAMNGWLERYVAAKGRVRGNRTRHFLEINAETTRGLVPLPLAGSRELESIAEA